MRPAAWAVALVMVAFALRLAVFRLDPVEAVRLDPDGAFTLALASLEAPQIVEITRYDIHPPGRYWLLHMWLASAGTSTFSAVMLPILESTLAVAAAYALGSALGGTPTGLATGLLVATLPPPILASQTVRSTALTLALGLLLLYAVVRAVRGPLGRQRAALVLALFTGALFLGVHTNYPFAALALPSLLLLLVAPARVRWAGWALAAAVGASLVLWLAWAMESWPASGIEGPSPSFAPLGDYILAAARLGLGGEFWPADQAIPFAAFLFWLGFGLWAARVWPLASTSAGDGRTRLLALAWGGAALAGAMAVYLTGSIAAGQNEAVNPRYLLVLLPLLLPILGFLLGAAWSRRRGLPWAGLLLAGSYLGFAAVGLWGFLARPAPDPKIWDPLATVRLLQGLVRDEEAILFDSLGQAGHYLRLTSRPAPWTYVTSSDLYFYRAIPPTAPPQPWPAWPAGAWLVLYQGGGPAGQHVLGLLEGHGYPALQTWLRDTLVAHFVLASEPLVRQAGGVQFTQGVELVAACWPGEVGAGQSVPLELAWRRGAQPLGDYTVFVHLLDSAGQLAAQHDAPPQNHRRPTSGWQPGELVRDYHGLPLPEAAPPGDYRLEVGLYDAGGRLLLADGRDRAALGSVPVGLGPLDRERPAANAGSGTAWGSDAASRQGPSASRQLPLLLQGQPALVGLPERVPCAVQEPS